MSVLCSIDGKLCSDDICCGGSCVRGGVPLEECDLCSNWFDPWEGCDCETGGDIGDEGMDDWREMA